MGDSENKRILVELTRGMLTALLWSALVFIAGISALLWLLTDAWNCFGFA